MSQKSTALTDGHFFFASMVSALEIFVYYQNKRMVILNYVSKINFDCNLFPFEAKIRVTLCFHFLLLLDED